MEKNGTKEVGIYILLLTEFRIYFVKHGQKNESFFFANRATLS